MVEPRCGPAMPDTGDREEEEEEEEEEENEEGRV